MPESELDPTAQLVNDMVVKHHEKTHGAFQVVIPFINADFARAMPLQIDKIEFDDINPVVFDAYDYQRPIGMIHKHERDEDGCLLLTIKFPQYTFPE